MKERLLKLTQSVDRLSLRERRFHSHGGIPG